MNKKEAPEEALYNYACIRAPSFNNNQLTANGTIDDPSTFPKEDGSAGISSECTKSIEFGLGMMMTEYMCMIMSLRSATGSLLCTGD